MFSSAHGRHINDSNYTFIANDGAPVTDAFIYMFHALYTAQSAQCSEWGESRRLSISCASTIVEMV